MPTESQLRDNLLRQRVRAFIEKGQLPASMPGEIHAGYGSGSICAACGEPITRNQVEFETVATLFGCDFTLVAMRCTFGLSAADARIKTKPCRWKGLCLPIQYYRK